MTPALALGCAPAGKQKVLHSHSQITHSTTSRRDTLPTYPYISYCAIVPLYCLTYHGTVPLYRTQFHLYALVGGWLYQFILSIGTVNILQVCTSETGYGTVVRWYGTVVRWYGTVVRWYVGALRFWLLPRRQPWSKPPAGEKTSNCGYLTFDQHLSPASFMITISCVLAYPPPCFLSDHTVVYFA